MDKEEFKTLQSLKGGIGCDLVTGTGTFTARKGAIYGAVSNADSSRIANITEIRSNLGTSADNVLMTGGQRTYLGSVDFNDNKFILFDYPLKSIRLSAGSAWVYYQEI